MTLRAVNVGKYFLKRLVRASLLDLQTHFAHCPTTLQFVRFFIIKLHHTLVVVFCLLI
jgi:hypothetical protein